MNSSFSGEQPSYDYLDQLAQQPEGLGAPTAANSSCEQATPNTSPFPADRTISTRPSRPRSAERRQPRADEIARIAAAMHLLGDLNPEPTIETVSDPISAQPFEPAIVPETYQDRSEDVLPESPQRDSKRPVTFEGRFTKDGRFNLLDAPDRIAFLTTIQNEQALGLLASGKRETPYGKVRLLPYEEVEKYYKAANAKGAERVIHVLGGVGELDFPTNRRYLSREWIDQHVDSTDQLRELAYPTARWEEIREPFFRLFGNLFKQGISDLDLRILSKVYFDALPVAKVAYLFHDRVALLTFATSATRAPLPKEAFANETRRIIAQREANAAYLQARQYGSRERRAEYRRQLWAELIGRNLHLRTIPEADPDTESLDLVTTEQIESFLVTNWRNRVSRKISKQALLHITNWDDIESKEFEAATQKYLRKEYHGSNFEQVRAVLRAYRHQYFSERAEWLNDTTRRVSAGRKLARKAAVFIPGSEPDYTPRPGDNNYNEYWMLNNMRQVHIPTDDFRKLPQDAA